MFILKLFFAFFKRTYFGLGSFICLISSHCENCYIAQVAVFNTLFLDVQSVVYFVIIHVAQALLLNFAITGMSCYVRIFQESSNFRNFSYYTDHGH